MSVQEHRTLSREIPVSCAIITVSDTRTVLTDKSGTLIRDRLEAAGHQVSGYEIVPDEPDKILVCINKMVSSNEIILLTGGTGISKRDRTYDVVSRLLEKTLPGFGEIFRMLSFEEIGPAAMLSRATAGIFQDCLLFSMPGSVNAVTLAMDRLIVPELQHLVWELVRQQKIPSI